MRKLHILERVPVTVEELKEFKADAEDLLKEVNEKCDFITKMQKNMMSRKLFFLNETRCRVYDTRITHQAPKVPAKINRLGTGRFIECRGGS